jgi:hypothetical protein
LLSLTIKDPSNIGGEFSKIEARFLKVRVAPDQLVCFDTGSITLATAKLLKKKLKSLGAKVKLTRTEVGKLVSVRSFEEWLKEHDTPELKFKHFFGTIGR